METPHSYQWLPIKFDVPIMHDLTGCEECARKMMNTWQRRQRFFQFYQDALKALDQCKEQTEIREAKLRVFRLALCYETAVEQDEAANKKYLQCGNGRMMKVIAIMNDSH